MKIMITITMIIIYMNDYNNNKIYENNHNKTKENNENKNSYNTTTMIVNLPLIIETITTK